MEWIKDALVARQQRELARQWQAAGQALLTLIQNQDALEAIPPEAAWSVINGLRAGMQGMERAVQGARQHELPPEARRALGEVSFALGTVVDVVEKYGVPAAENLYG